MLFSSLLPRHVVSDAQSQLLCPIGIPKLVLPISSKPPMSLGCQNIIHQSNASQTKKPKPLEEIFDKIMLAAHEEPVCQAIEKPFWPTFILTHTTVLLHLEHYPVLDLPSFSMFAPTSGNLVATGFKSQSAFHIASQKTDPLYNLQIDARVVRPNHPLLMLPTFTRNNRSLAVVQLSRKLEKVFVNHELAIACFLANKFCIGPFLFVNAPSLCASPERCISGGSCL
jgi:hypothetical protein